MATQFNFWHKKDDGVSAKTYDRQTARFLAVLGENMPEVSADIMQGWIENPKALQRILVKALCPSQPIAPQREFSTWRRMTAGSQRDLNNISKALKSNGFRISEWTLDILRALPVPESPQDLDLVNVSVLEMGFEEGATRDRIYARAQELGLQPIPAEIGPQLRVLYHDQPLGEWLIMGMEPIMDSAGRPRLFYLERDVDGHWLDTDCATPGRFWYGSYRWVFARAR